MSTGNNFQLTDDAARISFRSLLRTLDAKSRSRAIATCPVFMLTTMPGSRQRRGNGSGTGKMLLQGSRIGQVQESFMISSGDERRLGGGFECVAE